MTGLAFDLELALGQGAGLLVALALPVMLVAAACGLVASALGGLLGVSDTTLATVARALGTVAVVLLLGGVGWGGLRDFTVEWWGSMHEVDHRVVGSP